MIYGYARVSTTGQAINGNSLSDQIRQLKDAGAVEILSEHYTGTTVDRPVFSDLVSRLQPGDTLIVTKLDRFARTSLDGARLIKSMLDNGIRVWVLNMGVIENTPMGRIIYRIMLAVAEFERDMIHDRTQEGKEEARRNNPDYHEGRPRVYNHEELAELIKAGKTYQDIGIGKTLYYRMKRELGLSKRTAPVRARENESMVLMNGKPVTGISE